MRIDCSEFSEVKFLCVQHKKLPMASNSFETLKKYFNQEVSSLNKKDSLNIWSCLGMLDVDLLSENELAPMVDFWNYMLFISFKSNKGNRPE